MNMPGFSAGFSVYRTDESYRMGGTLQGAEALIRPAQFLAPDCFGDTCIADNCLGLIGRAFTNCTHACAAPSRCSPCTCRCDANCNRSCTRTCSRTHLSSGT